MLFGEAMPPSGGQLRMRWQQTHRASHSAWGVSAVRLFGLSNEQDFPKLLKPRCHWPSLNQQLSASVALSSCQGGTGFGRAGILMEMQYWGHTHTDPLLYTLAS